MGIAKRNMDINAVKVKDGMLYKTQYIHMGIVHRYKYWSGIWCVVPCVAVLAKREVIGQVKEADLDEEF